MLTLRALRESTCGFGARQVTDFPGARAVGAGLGSPLSRRGRIHGSSEQLSIACFSACPAGAYREPLSAWEPAVFSEDAGGGSTEWVPGSEPPPSREDSQNREPEVT